MEYEKRNNMVIKRLWALTRIIFYDDLARNADHARPHKLPSSSLPDTSQPPAPVCHTRSANICRIYGITTPPRPI